MEAGVSAEWDRLRTVVVHRPGIEMFFGLLEPFSALYERAFSRHLARREHERLEFVLKNEFSVDVLPFKETLLDLADRVPPVRENLISASSGEVSYRGPAKVISAASAEMAKNAHFLDSGHFFNILLLRPTIGIRPKKGSRDIHLHITEREPLANLYFMRDQQAITDRGVCLSRMAKPQRERETVLTRLFWNSMGIPITHETAAPGTFEGGDFIPMGSFALVGTGDRTNVDGAKQLLSSGVGFDEIAIVNQPKHPLVPGGREDPMITMHLDTYCNVAAEGVVVGSRTLLEHAQVEVYQRCGSGYEPVGKTGKKDRINLFSFLKEKDCEVIDVTTLEQLAYAPNFLCIGNRTILSVEVDRVAGRVLENLRVKAAAEPARYGRLLAKAEEDYRRLRFEGQFFPHKKEVYRHDIDAYPIVLENLTGGYGGAHCMTCAVRRN
ncbi:MAG: arginine deiminase family protein [Methanoregulaceae archaeon]|nr:arginine deiminase family protein [Methanoregulaceae archaeon]